MVAKRVACMTRDAPRVKVVGSETKVVSERVTSRMASNCYPQTVARYRATIRELGSEVIGNVRRDPRCVSKRVAVTCKLSGRREIQG